MRLMYPGRIAYPETGDQFHIKTGTSKSGKLVYINQFRPVLTSFRVSSRFLVSPHQSIYTYVYG